MNDLISRQAAIDAVNEWLKLYAINRTMSNVTSMQDILRQLPSVQPEQQWIPCSERLPEKDGRYFVTLENGYTKILGYATTQTIRYPQGFYYISENRFSWRQTTNPVIAWVPLPELYKGEQE